MKTLEFIGFSPGLPPFGREPLFRVAGQVNPLTKAAAAKLGFTIPAIELDKITRALTDWNDRGLCDDNLFLFRGSM